MGETPKTALPPQDRAASPRPRCIAISHPLNLTYKIGVRTQSADLAVGWAAS
ncbi:MAG: hypothetical protein F6J99_10070 [Moorea sp. SIO4G3]|nr:hypothetical protein [Moorena sp. SIO4G3]